MYACIFGILGETVMLTAHLVNLSPSTTIDFKSPDFVWSGKLPDYSRLRVFGCVAYTCDDLSGRVRGTDSYLVSNPTSLGWWRKSLNGKRLPSIKTEAFSECLAKGS